MSGKGKVGEEVREAEAQAEGLPEKGSPSPSASGRPFSRPLVAGERGTEIAREWGRRGGLATAASRRLRRDIRGLLEEGLEFAIGGLRDEIRHIDQRMEKAQGRAKGGTVSDHRQRSYLLVELGKLCARIVPLSVSHSGSVGVHVPQDVPPHIVHQLKAAARALQERGLLGPDGLPVDVAALPSAAAPEGEEGEPEPAPQGEDAPE